MQIYILGVGSSREGVFEHTNGYHAVGFFSCCRFFYAAKIFCNLTVCIWMHFSYFVFL